MPKTPKSIVVQPPSGVSTVVDILDASASSLTCYTTESGAVAHSLPVTITSDTAFWLAADGARTYSVSAKIGDREVAGRNGATSSVEFTSATGNGQQIFVPVTVDRVELAGVAATGGGAGSGTSSPTIVNTVAAHYVASDNERIFCAAATTTDVTAPAPGGKSFSVTNTGLTGSVTVLPDAAESILGSPSYAVAPGATVIFADDNTDWWGI